MSEDNTIAQVANGNAPQPNTKVETDYRSLQREMEDAVDSGLELEDIDDLDLDEDDGPQLKNPEQLIADAQAKGDLTKAQAQQLKKTLKIKVDGVEQDEVLDFNDDKKLQEYIQKSKAFDKRSNEFAQTKMQLEALVKALRENPEDILEKLGHNVDDLSEKRLSKKVEELKKSPEQIEREKMEKELNSLREEKKRIDQERKTLEEENLRNQEASKIESEISEALNMKSTILPKNDPEVLKEIAHTMALAMQRGFDTVTAKDVIPYVEKKWLENMNRYFNGSTEEVLEKLVGKANLDRYRKKAVAAKRASPGVQTATAKQIVKDTGTQKQTEVEDASKKKKFKSVFDYS